MTLACEMPVATIAALIGEHDTCIWRVLHHYVDEAREKVDISEVERVGMDETASRRGHNYITLFYDLDEKRLLFGTEGQARGGYRTNHNLIRPTLLWENLISDYPHKTARSRE